MQELARPVDPDLEIIFFQGDHQSFDPYRKRWEEDLSKILRFSQVEITHRVNIADHQRIIHDTALPIAEFVEDLSIPINTIRAGQLGLHHDDPEALTSDVPKNVKRAMTPAQRAKLYSEEEIAARILAVRYLPPEFKERYLEYFYENSAKQTLEAQVVDIADKATGLAETLNGIRCGDTALFPVLEEYRKIIAELEEYPIFSKVSAFVGLDHVPTAKQANEMSKIDLTLIDQGEGAFWQRVLDPSLPLVLRNWMDASLHLSTPGHNVLFPAWQERVNEADATWALR